MEFGRPNAIYSANSSTDLGPRHPPPPPIPHSAPISTLNLTIHDPKSAMRTPNFAIAMLPDDYSIEDANVDFFD